MEREINKLLRLDRKLPNPTWNIYYFLIVIGTYPITSVSTQPLLTFLNRHSNRQTMRLTNSIQLNQIVLTFTTTT